MSAFTGSLHRRATAADAPRARLHVHADYMGPLNPAALACMKELQHECFKMGIPLNTRHREVAPNQYEFTASPPVTPSHCMYDAVHTDGAALRVAAAGTSARRTSESPARRSTRT
jgi:hypothetical protein